MKKRALNTLEMAARAELLNLAAINAHAIDLICRGVAADVAGTVQTIRGILKPFGLRGKLTMRKVYEVLSNGKPAQLHNPELVEWSNYKFNEITEAISYANSWLKPWGPIPEGYILGMKYDYNGYGDTIMIVEHEEKDLREKIAYAICVATATGCTAHEAAINRIMKVIEEEKNA